MKPQFHVLFDKVCAGRKGLTPRYIRAHRMKKNILDTESKRKKLLQSEMFFSRCVCVRAQKVVESRGMRYAMLLRIFHSECMNSALALNRATGKAEERATHVLFQVSEKIASQRKGQKTCLPRKDKKKSHSKQVDIFCFSRIDNRHHGRGYP